MTWQPIYEERLRKRMMDLPDAHKCLENDIHNYGVDEAMKRNIEDLRRLTQQYHGKRLEEVIAGMIKGEILAYVYSSNYYPPYHKTVTVNWGLSLKIMPLPPTIDNLPVHGSGIYIFVKTSSDTLSDLYFVSNWYKECPLIKVEIEQTHLQHLANELFISASDIDKRNGIILELTPD